MSETATTPFRASNPVDTKPPPRKLYVREEAGDPAIATIVPALIVGGVWLFWVVCSFVLWAWGAWEVQLRALAVIVFYFVVWCLAFVRYGVKS